MQLHKYLSIKVRPKTKTIFLFDKYPESTFVFEYADGESARIDSYDDVTPKGQATLVANLTGALDPKEEDKAEVLKEYKSNQICAEDLAEIQAVNSWFYVIYYALGR